jgi:hypothetical protein
MPNGDGYEQVARGIAAYLAARQGPDGAFPGPDHYGVAFALWLWSYFPDEFAEQMERAWARLEREPPQSHGEFNAYALLHLRERLGGGHAETCPPYSGFVDAVVRRIRFGRRHSANWMLLRAACTALPGPHLSRLSSWLEARLALAAHMRGGFIHDRPGVRSVAYHAFCGALLADIWKQRRARWAGAAAARAAGALLPLVLPNGDALYVGRGQEQIFGYGALLCLLEAARQITGDDAYGAAAQRAFQYVLRFRREDGSFPLVLLEAEAPEPWHPDAGRPGWYSYNRYADYLPFLGCFLMRAARAEGSAPAGDAGCQPFGAAQGRPALRAGTLHPAFRLIVKDRYAVVLSAPGGATTNDLAFPYLCVDGESLFPCYGGEADGRRLKACATEAMPLPYGQLASGETYAFRERLSYRLMGNDLIGVSPLVRHERRFEFGRDGFTCRDEIAFRRQCVFTSFVPANFLFRNLRPTGDGDFETEHGRARARLRLLPDGRAHADAATTASGALAALRCSRGETRVRAGDRVSTGLEVWFPQARNDGSPRRHEERGRDGRSAAPGAGQARAQRNSPSPRGGL